MGYRAFNSKLSHKYIKKYVKKKGDKLLSKRYFGNKEKLSIKCGACDNKYKQTFDKFQRGYQHQYCKEKEKENCNGSYYKTPVTLKPKICIQCGVEFQPNYSKKKLCSVECRKQYEASDDRKDHYRKIGSMGGKMSATIQSRRSKNEILFANKCIDYYGKDNIETNKPLFGKWDADVILTNIKIAVMWNGAWHYTKLRDKHDVEDVQRRDALKIKEIIKCKYISYIIKDMGKHSPKFVQEQFEIFQDFVSRVQTTRFMKLIRKPRETNERPDNI